MYLQHQAQNPPPAIHSALYHEILVTSHIVRQKSDLVQKLSLGNENIKIKIKWKNLSCLVLTSSYSEGQRKQAPTHACSLMQVGHKPSNARGVQRCDREGAAQTQGRKVWYCLLSVNRKAFGIQNFQLSQ